MQAAIAWGRGRSAARRHAWSIIRRRRVPRIARRSRAQGLAARSLSERTNPRAVAVAPSGADQGGPRARLRGDDNRPELPGQTAGLAPDLRAGAQARFARAPIDPADHRA